MPSPKRDAVAIRSGGTWIIKAWKWGAGSLSAGAALVSIISSVRSLPADHVRWIGVRPTADTAWAIGDSIQLALTITDAHGGIVPGVRVGWTSTDTAVATVDSAGTVVARAPGSATVVAAAGGRIAQSRILVRPRAAAIWLQGDSVLRLGEGAVTRLVARAVDARRHPVAGQPITWRSSDPAVAAVDSAGRVIGVTAGVATLAAAGGDLVLERPVEVAPVPATITLLAGDGQRAPAGQRLATPLKAQIVSRGGRPMAGVRVRFAVAEQTGRFAPDVDTSDADGIVQAVWTMGDRPGRQRSSLAVDGDPPIATALAAEAEPVAVNTRITIVEPASGVAGEELSEPVGVRVTDSTGNPLSDLPVSWQAEGGGAIAGDGVRTDSLGQARARWTLGPRAGIQRALVQVGASRAVPRAVLAATALPGPAASIAAAHGTKLRGVAGRPLNPAVQLGVADRHGNAVPGVRITLRPAQGTVADRAAVTDSTGRVTPLWTLGSTAGIQHLSASAEGVNAPVDVAVRVAAGPPDRVVLEGVPATAPAGRALPQAIRVLVSDAHGNPTAGTSVQFTAKSGAVAPARVRTDSAGRALARWMLGTRAGEQVVEVVVKEGGVRAVGRVQAGPAPKRKAR
ncbi:MAG: Ig-like domain-containing protein [Gemmatimonadales bacterium]